MAKYDKEYLEYINSREWAIIRNKVLMRDNFECSICGNTRDLQVHHLNYNNFKNEINHLEDLMTLCKSCHEKIEDKKKEQDEEKYRRWQDYCEEQKRKMQLSIQENKKKENENFKRFIYENKDKDLSNINGGYLDFCSYPCLNKFLAENYDQEFINHFRKMDITNFFGLQRTHVIAKFIYENKSNWQIKKYGFTNKRISKLRETIEKFKSYDDIFELLRNEYEKKRYGFVISKTILEEFIEYGFIHDKKYNKETLIHNLDNLINYANLCSEIENDFVIIPKLEIIESEGK